MSEKITYGIKNVHVAKISVSSEGTVTYGEPKALPGASEITLSTVGDPVKVFADNVVYYKAGVNQGYSGNLVIYNVPDWFEKDYLGMFEDSNGVLVEDSAGVSAEFALIFEFNTDSAKTKRNVMYNCSASRPEISGSTKNKPKMADQPYIFPTIQ